MLLHELLLVLIVDLIFVFDLLLHALDAVILDVDLFFAIVVLHVVLVDLVMLLHLLLLLDGLGNGTLLLRVELVEVVEVLLVEDLLLLLHG